MSRRSKSVIQADAGIQIPTGAAAGLFLGSDGSGNGSWQSVPAGAGGLMMGTGAPSAGAGVDGAFYIDSVNGRFYGPKAAGAWPASVYRLVPLAPTYAQLTSG